MRRPGVNKTKSPKVQVVDCTNNALTVFDGADSAGSLVERDGTFHAYDIGGRCVGAFAEMGAAARSLPGGRRHG
jgi:hypothetical protein